jgi:hypothetical protein
VLGLLFMILSILPGFYIYGAYYSEYPIPVGVVSRFLYDLVYNAGGKSNMTFLHWDPNPWAPLLSGPNFEFYRTLLAILEFRILVYYN